MKLFLRPLRRQQDNGNASLPLAVAADVAVAAAVTVALATLHNSAGHELTIKFSAELA